MTLLGKMDRLVYATGIDRIIFLKMPPRRLRWTPLLVIAALVAGFAMMAKAGSPIQPGGLVGWLLFYGAYLAAGLVRVFGPRFRPTFDHPLDEREVMVRARAYALSGLVLASLAMMACFYMAAAGLLPLWRPQQPFEWVNLGFAIQACGLLLPTLVASWLEPPADRED